jgi:hypothetical protein
MVDTIICTIDHCWMDSTLAAISSSSRRHSFVWSFHGPHFHGHVGFDSIFPKTHSSEG